MDVPPGGVVADRDLVGETAVAKQLAVEVDLRVLSDHDQPLAVAGDGRDRDHH
jgi:hypothetical protein